MALKGRDRAERDALVDVLRDNLPHYGQRLTQVIYERCADALLAAGYRRRDGDDG